MLDRFGLTASLYLSAVTDSRFDGLELYTDGDGLHWQWGVTREMNLQLLKLLERHWEAVV